jgi:hypothetical protein
LLLESAVCVSGRAACVSKMIFFSASVSLLISSAHIASAFIAPSSSSKVIMFATTDHRYHCSKGVKEYVPSPSAISLSSDVSFQSDTSSTAAISTAALKQKELERFPRTKLAHLPTPLEYCPRLSKALNGVNIYIKRDDCTGLATGGNKARKLEWLMADAAEQVRRTLSLILSSFHVHITCDLMIHNICCTFSLQNSLCTIFAGCRLCHDPRCNSIQSLPSNSRSGCQTWS